MAEEIGLAPAGKAGQDIAVHCVQASVDEGIRLLQAYRAIPSPAIRARILTLVVLQAQRRTGPT